MFQPNSGELNENLVSYTKGLSYNSTDNTYELTLQVKSSSDTSFINHVNNVRIEYSDSAHEFSATAPADGYYLVQIWGGAGGIGAGNRGGSGGSGGYIQGVVHLNKDDLVTSTIGADGADGGSARNGGHGGNYTSFNINNETILIAGGGGGGGGTGGLLGLFSGGNGESGSTDSYSTSLDYDITQYNGKDGEAGSTTAFGSGGAGGNAGQNFKSSTVSDDASNLGSAAQEIVNSASYSDYTLNDLGGAIYISGRANNSITGIEFQNNTATDGNGGTIYLSSASSKIENCDFTGGVASQSGGTIYAIEESESLLTINMVTISNSTATNGSGGGIYAECSVDSDYLIISDSSANADTGLGGGIYLGCLSAIVSNTADFKYVLLDKKRMD